MEVLSWEPATILLPHPTREATAPPCIIELSDLLSSAECSQLMTACDGRPSGPQDEAANDGDGSSVGAAAAGAADAPTSTGTPTSTPAATGVGASGDDDDSTPPSPHLHQHGGFQSLSSEYPATYRTNDRLVFRNPALSQALWARIVPLLRAQDIAGARPSGYGTQGVWKPVGLNDVFKMSRYGAGDAFRPHRDGTFVVNDDVRSVLSLMVYLNDSSTGTEGGEAGFSGGETRWFADKPLPSDDSGTVDGGGGEGGDETRSGGEAGRGGKDGGGGESGSATVLPAVPAMWTRSPLAGLGVIFPHAMYHEGCPVRLPPHGSEGGEGGKSGESGEGGESGESGSLPHSPTPPANCKYIIRTDVLFARVESRAESIVESSNKSPPADGLSPLSLAAPPAPPLLRQYSDRFNDMCELFRRSSEEERGGDPTLATELYVSRKGVCVRERERERGRESILTVVHCALLCV